MREREVVKEERRMRVENQPYGRLSEIIYDQAFTVHPYKHPTIGSMADLEAASIDDVRDFYRTYYVPTNATLVLVGDFDPAQALELVTQYLGRVPKADRPVPRDIPQEPPQHAGAARDARGAVAAAGRRGGVPHHLRRAPRLLSAAHRVEDAVRRPEFAHLPEARLRDAASRSTAFGGGNIIEEPNLFYAVADRAARAHAGGGREGAGRRARSAEEPSRSASASCSAPRTSSRATTSSAASRTSRRRRSWRTPSSSTTATSRPPTASSTSS